MWDFTALSSLSGTGDGGGDGEDALVAVITQFMKDNEVELQRQRAYVFPALYALVVAVEGGLKLRDRYASTEAAAEYEVHTSAISPHWLNVEGALSPTRDAEYGVCVASATSGDHVYHRLLKKHRWAPDPRSLANKTDGLRFLWYLLDRTPKDELSTVLLKARSFANVRKYVYYNAADARYHVFLALYARGEDDETLRRWWWQQPVEEATTRDFIPCTLVPWEFEGLVLGLGYIKENDTYAESVAIAMISAMTMAVLTATTGDANRLKLALLGAAPAVQPEGVLHWYGHNAEGIKIENILLGTAKHLSDTVNALANAETEEGVVKVLQQNVLLATAVGAAAEHIVAGEEIQGLLKAIANLFVERVLQSYRLNPLFSDSGRRIHTQFYHGYIGEVPNSSYFYWNDLRKEVFQAHTACILQKYYADEWKGRSRARDPDPLAAVLNHNETSPILLDVYQYDYKDTVPFQDLTLCIGKRMPEIASANGVAVVGRALHERMHMLRNPRKRRYDEEPPVSRAMREAYKSDHWEGTSYYFVLYEAFNSGGYSAAMSVPSRFAPYIHPLCDRLLQANGADSLLPPVLFARWVAGCAVGRDLVDSAPVLRKRLCAVLQHDEYGGANHLNRKCTVVAAEAVLNGATLTKLKKHFEGVFSALSAEEAQRHGDTHANTGGQLVGVDAEPKIPLPSLDGEDAPDNIRIPAQYVLHFLLHVMLAVIELDWAGGVVAAVVRRVDTFDKVEEMFERVKKGGSYGSDIHMNAFDFSAFEAFWRPQSAAAAGDGNDVQTCKAAASIGVNARITTPTQLAGALFGLLDGQDENGVATAYEAYVYPVGYDSVRSLQVPPTQGAPPPKWWSDTDTRADAISFVVAIVTRKGPNKTCERVVHRCLDSIYYGKTGLDPHNWIGELVEAANRAPAETELVFYPPLFPTAYRYERARTKFRSVSNTTDESVVAYTWAMLDRQIAPVQWLNSTAERRETGFETRLHMLSMTVDGAFKSYLYWNLRLGVGPHVSPVLDAVNWGCHVPHPAGDAGNKAIVEALDKSSFLTDALKENHAAVVLMHSGKPERPYRLVSTAAGAAQPAAAVVSPEELTRVAREVSASFEFAADAAADATNVGIKRDRVVLAQPYSGLQLTMKISAAVKAQMKANEDSDERMRRAREEVVANIRRWNEAKERAEQQAEARRRGERLQEADVNVPEPPQLEPLPPPPPPPRAVQSLVRTMYTSPTVRSTANILQQLKLYGSVDVLSCLVHVCVCYHQRYVGYGPLKEAIEKCLVGKGQKLLADHDPPAWLKSAVKLASAATTTNKDLYDTLQELDADGNSYPLPGPFRVLTELSENTPDLDVLHFMCNYTVRSWRTWWVTSSNPRGVLLSRALNGRLTYAFGVEQQPTLTHHWFDMALQSSYKPMLELPFRIPVEAAQNPATTMLSVPYFNMETLRFENVECNAREWVDAMVYQVGECLSERSAAPADDAAKRIRMEPQQSTRSNDLIRLERLLNDDDVAQLAQQPFMKSVLAALSDYVRVDSMYERANELSDLIPPLSFLRWASVLLTDLLTQNATVPNRKLGGFPPAHPLNLEEEANRKKTSKSTAVLVDAYPTGVTLRTMSKHDLRAYCVTRLPMCDGMDAAKTIRSVLRDLIAKQFAMTVRVCVAKVQLKKGTDDEYETVTESEDLTLYAYKGNGKDLAVIMWTTVMPDATGIAGEDEIVGVTQRYNDALLKLRLQSYFYANAAATD